MGKNIKYCLLTNDVETTSIWHNDLRDSTGFKVYREGMPLLLNIYRKYNVKSTFYFTGYIAKLIPDIVKMVLKDGHEVGSHGLRHEKEFGFDVMSLDSQIEHLNESKKILEDIISDEVISFRAPALRTNEKTVKALLETGFKIDSSVASQRFDMFFSFGALKKLNWLLSPRLPYVSSIDNIFKSGNDGIVEVPLSATGLPYLGTTMRIFPTITSLQRRLLHYESLINKKPIVFDIHPNELIDETDEKRKINRRSKNLLSYFIQDYMRSKLKSKNLGKDALLLYEKEINFFSNSNYKFTTIKDYCLQNKLIT